MRTRGQVEPGERTKCISYIYISCRSGAWIILAAFLLLVYAGIMDHCGTEDGLPHGRCELLGGGSTLM